jgi:hypothetical protein
MQFSGKLKGGKSTLDLTLLQLQSVANSLCSFFVYKYTFNIRDNRYLIYRYLPCHLSIRIDIS